MKVEKYSKNVYFIYSDRELVGEIRLSEIYGELELNTLKIHKTITRKYILTLTLNSSVREFRFKSKKERQQRLRELLKLLV